MITDEIQLGLWSYPIVLQLLLSAVDNTHAFI